MGITITTAPCCWGVDDVTNPNLPSWERVFDEVAAAGYGGLELGPYGYVPLDLKRVSEALRARGLFIVAGTIFDDLVSPANREELLRQTDEICALVAQLPQPAPGAGQRFATPYLTVMDWGHDERDYAAGHSDRAPRLSDADWAGMVANIRAIAARARGYGVRAVHASACRRLHRIRRRGRAHRQRTFPPRRRASASTPATATMPAWTRWRRWSTMPTGSTTSTSRTSTGRCSTG